MLAVGLGVLPRRAAVSDDDGTRGHGPRTSVVYGALAFCGFLFCAPLERGDFLRFFLGELFAGGLFRGTFG